MKSLFLFTSISIILIHSDWQPVQIDSTLESLEIDRSDWTYPWYVIKHDTYFENTTGEGISESDTAHLIRNSGCQVASSSNTGNWTFTSRLPFADQTWKEDTLIISIYQESASDNQELVLTIVDQQFTAEYQIAYVFPTDDWQVKIEEASLSVSQHPQEGEPIKGQVEIFLREIVEWPEWKSNEVDTIQKKIQGTFVIEGN